MSVTYVGANLVFALLGLSASNQDRPRWSVLVGGASPWQGEHKVRPYVGSHSAPSTQHLRAAYVHYVDKLIHTS